jgi:hypothetical protein
VLTTASRISYSSYVTLRTTERYNAGLVFSPTIPLCSLGSRKFHFQASYPPRKPMGILSLRSLLGFLIGLTAIVVVLIAFIPIYQVGVKAVEDSTHHLRVSLVSRIQDQISLFYAGPTRTARELSSVFNRGILDPSLHDYQAIRQITCPTIFPPRPYGYTGCNVGLEDGFFVTCSLNQASSGPTGTLGSRLRLQIPGQPLVAVSGPIDNQTFAYIGTPPASLPTYDHRLRPFYQPILQGLGWSPLYITSSNPAITAGATLFNSSGARIGILMVEFQSVYISQFLRNISLGKTGAAVVIHEQSASLLGFSWSEPLINNRNVSSIVTVNGTNVTRLPLSRSTDTWRT